MRPVHYLAIERNPWFLSMPAPLRAAVLERAAASTFAHGAPVFRAGERATCLFGIAQGCVRISRTAASARQLTFRYLPPGMWHGAGSALGRLTHCNDAHAQGATTLLTLGTADIEALLFQYPELYKVLLALESQRARWLVNAAADLTFLSLRERIVKQLRRLALDFGVRNAASPGEVRIALGITQGEIGQLVGGSRQRVSTELSALAAEGLLRVDSRGIVLCEPLAPAAAVLPDPGVSRPCLPGDNRASAAARTLRRLQQGDNP